MIRQRTIQKTVKAMGVGVHRGEKVTMSMHPAPTNHGIVFRRMDLDTVVEIPAQSKYVGDVALSTSLIKDGAKVKTIEHLLSALSGLGIDNLIVDLDSEEVPIMDGSSSPFVFLINTAGVKEQNEPKRFFRVKKTVEVRVHDKYLRVSPCEGFKVDLKIDFDHPLFHDKNQEIALDFSVCSYSKEIARARTFGFVADYEKIRQSSLAKGASMSNTVVMDDFSVMNEGGMRYFNEPLKHKALDLVGDLYLLGYNCLAYVCGYKTGHALNTQLLAALLADEDAFEIVTFESEMQASSLGFLFPSQQVAV